MPVGLGVGTLLYSMMTRYELGVIKLIPFKTHLLLDLLSGIFLAASPWILGFSHIVYWPHLLVGLSEVVASLNTHTMPELLPRNGVQHHRT